MKEMVGGCCVCSDERGWPDNPLVYCDGNGCTVAVHQACYGIVTVPTGPWYCRKCESPETKGKVRCELCPSKSGALKRTDTGGWAHVVCALYIPEVRFGNVTSMEPIVLRLIPPERYNKTCYICQEQGKTHRSTAGACMQCNKSGCKQQFHVTCAQGLGLLCEEAGNYLDNVKYCGYCQHHYSKLKKGGNVKTIPPYKPVSHDSQSSDSSGEKEGDASPAAGGSATPTHAKPKGAGRKSAHASAKGAPSAAKTPASASAQPMDTGAEGGDATTSRKHKSADKRKLHDSSDKKKPSPSRRGSGTGAGAGAGAEAGAPAKPNTPAPPPSPQHVAAATAADPAQPPPAKISASASGGPKAASPAAAPPKPAEPVGVISSVASAVATAAAAVASPPPLPPAAATSVVQPPAPKPPAESVITNAEASELKQTKKRKAAAAAAAQPAPIDYATTAAVAAGSDPAPPGPGPWEAHGPPDVQMDPADKAIKKAKTEMVENVPPPPQFTGAGAAPPPAHSPASNPSPRLVASPMPGPSGLGQASATRSPSQPPPAQGGKGDRDGPASLLVSVPLPSVSHGLNLSASAHAQVSPAADMAGPSPHIFHQPQKLAAMEPSLSGHPHAMPSRSWGGLNISYEMQQDPNKPGVSGMGGTSKDMAAMSSLPPAVRNKKRAAMAASMAAMATPPPIQTVTTQSLANVRRPPQPTPPPLYHETIKDSPPSSPGSERHLDAKMCAPHMLGNELNPESGAAACLQEQLSAELAAHAAGAHHAHDALVPPPLINKAAPGTGGNAGRGSSGAQSLDQLLERQWEQGSQFLMEQAQHFDIASLLSCLHQLRTENVRLEEHVGSLLQRRDHLLAVNARLAIPLTAEVEQSKPYSAAGVSCGLGPPEAGRGPREPCPPRPPPPRGPETITSERAHQLIMREVQQKPS